jgi:hypothetical protein
MRLLKYCLLGLLVSSVSVFALEPEGTDAGNGGDDYAREFINLGLEIAESLAQNPIPGLDAKDLLRTIQATQVNSQESLVLRGDKVDAINIPWATPQKILVSRTGWDRMRSQRHRQAFLVLHEYLGIMGIDDSRYQVSGLLDRGSVCGRNPVVRREIEKTLKKSCYRIVADDLLYVEAVSFLTGKEMGPLVRSDFSGLANLYNISFGPNSKPESLAADVFASVASSLKYLQFGYFSLNSLKDCSFLHTLRETETIHIWDSLTDVASGCFQYNRNLKYLKFGIQLDGKRGFEMNGFLNDAGSEGTLALYLEAKGGEWVPVEEFAETKFKILEITHRGITGGLDDTYHVRLSKVTGKSCEYTGQGNYNEHDVYTVTCK